MKHVDDLLKEGVGSSGLENDKDELDIWNVVLGYSNK